MGVKDGLFTAKIKSTSMPLRCGVIEGSWESHGHNTRQMNGFLRVGRRKRAIGLHEIIETGLLWTCGTKVRKSGKRTNPGMCTRKQKSWSTMQTLDGHHRMDRADDYWGSKIDWRSRSLERNPTHRQPFIWRKALNDDDGKLFQMFMILQVKTYVLISIVHLFRW